MRRYQFSIPYTQYLDTTVGPFSRCRRGHLTSSGSSRFAGH